MADDRSLLELAAALADGKPVDWESAARSISSPSDRALLAELQFIARVTRLDRSHTDSSATPRATEPAKRWGPLDIIELVGRGTFGDVYRAWDRRLDREVALKILRRRARDQEPHASAAIQEGRLLARVRHPNVVTVYGAERVDDRVGVWMEFIHGKTLEEELRARGPFDVDRVIKIGRELASALAIVHGAGVIHRDVKAQNVMRDGDGRLVLTDFGAGVELEEVPDGAARELAGTPLSVAPEVLAGHTATPQSDVYSLGVLLYHLLTGTYPVRGQSLKEVREAHASGTRVPLREARHDLPDALVQIIDRTLDPDPQRRHDTAAILGADLAALAFAGSDSSEWKMHSGGRRWKYAVLAVLGLAALGTGSWATYATLFAETFTIIEFPGATETYLLEISDQGVMVGSYVDATGITHGFRLSAGNFVTVDFPDAVRTRPTGLNNGGAIVGDFTDAGGAVHGFHFLADVFTVIDVPGATYTRANAINAAGDVVGDYKDAKGTAHAFLLREGIISSFDVPDGTNTRAIGLNDEGDIVGDYRDASGVRGFLLTKNHFTRIAVPQSVVTQAFGVNVEGTIVGSYAAGSPHGFSLRNNAFTSIDVPGAVWTQAGAINSSGAIVGTFLGGSPVRERGFLLAP